MPVQVKGWHTWYRPKKLLAEHGHPHQTPEKPKVKGTVPWRGASRAWPIPSATEPQFPHLYGVGMGTQSSGR